MTISNKGPREGDIKEENGDLFRFSGEAWHLIAINTTIEGSFGFPDSEAIARELMQVYPDKGSFEKVVERLYPGDEIAMNRLLLARRHIVE